MLNVLSCYACTLDSLRMLGECVEGRSLTRMFVLNVS
jgi:hypothetical protein